MRSFEKPAIHLGAAAVVLAAIWGCQAMLASSAAPQVPSQRRWFAVPSTAHVKLLEATEVQDELQLTKDQRLLITESFPHVFDGHDEKLSIQQLQELNESDSKQKLHEVLAAAEKLQRDAVDKVVELFTSAQANRWRELRMQNLGFRSLQDEDISKWLSLTGDQREKIRTMVNPRQNNQPQSQIEFDEPLQSVFTDKQRKQWYDHLGTRFDFSHLTPYWMPTKISARVP